METWHFYLPDSDRNSGWSNHTYVLQFVCSGTGDTIEAAWAAADKPERFSLPERLTAIKQSDETLVGALNERQLEPL